MVGKMGGKIKVILVEPEYEENIGLIARAIGNFGLKELILVNPKANHKSAKAKSRAMHSAEILKKAKIVNSLQKALTGVDYSVATTAKITKEKKLYRKALIPKQLASLFADKKPSLAIIFGREATGLRNEEINACDLVVKIPTTKYVTLNISHSVAIILYALLMEKRASVFKVADKKVKERLLIKVAELLTKSRGIKDKKAVKYAFKQLINRAAITEREAKTIMAFFDRVG